MAESADPHDPEPESDTRLQLMGVPTEADVCNFRYWFSTFS